MKEGGGRSCLPNEYAKNAREVIGHYAGISASHDVAVNSSLWSVYCAICCRQPNRPDLPESKHMLLNFKIKKVCFNVSAPTVSMLKVFLSALCED